MEPEQLTGGLDIRCELTKAAERESTVKELMKKRAIRKTEIAFE